MTVVDFFFIRHQRRSTSLWMNRPQFDELVRVGDAAAIDNTAFQSVVDSVVVQAGVVIIEKSCNIKVYSFGSVAFFLQGGFQRYFPLGEALGC